MKRLALFNLFFSILTGLNGVYTQALNAKENRYNVSDIPKNLLENAKAVIRNKETVFEVFSASQAVEKVKYAITVLNANGINESLFTEYYDSFSKIKRIEAAVYNAQGELVKTIGSSAIQDYSAMSRYSLYEDTRVKFIDPKYGTVPFTVEYSFEIEYSGLLYYPNWRLYEGYNISVEKSAFKVIAPDSLKIRYYETNIDSVLKIIRRENHTVYSWELLNQAAMKQEAFSPPLNKYTPVVYMAPSDFEINGFRGNSESWKNFGQWNYLLNRQRNILGKEAEDRIKNLVVNAKTEKEKIQILYEYLQNKTRYVSTQVGIGGWQTIDAPTVDRLSYGDCKALTNYMQALLKIIDVKSYGALVRAGPDAPDLISAFPSSQFNHIFLCVPGEKDTTWLECTSQQEPFGFTGTFTDDRDVLIVKEYYGGILTHTHALTQKDSRQERNAIVTLDSAGNGRAFVKTTYKGKFYEDMSFIIRMDEKDKKRTILKNINIPNFELVDFKHFEHRSSAPSIEEEINLRLNNYGTLLGDRALLGLNLMTKMDALPDQAAERRSTIFIRRAYTNIDTIIYKIPPGYVYNVKPELKSINSQFGEYNAKLIASETEIKYIRLFRLNKGNYPPSGYPDFADFMNKISQADEYKVVLKKK